MKIPSLGLVLAALATLALTTEAFARPGGGDCSGRERGGLERRVDALDLDAETRSAVDAALDEARVERRAIKQELRSAREQMHALLSEEAPATDAVLAQADAIGALEAKLHRERLLTLLEVRELVGTERWSLLGEGTRSRGLR